MQLIDFWSPIHTDLSVTLPKERGSLSIFSHICHLHSFVSKQLIDQFPSLKLITILLGKVLHTWLTTRIKPPELRSSLLSVPFFFFFPLFLSSFPPYFPFFSFFLLPISPLLLPFHLPFLFPFFFSFLITNSEQAMGIFQ